MSRIIGGILQLGYLYWEMVLLANKLKNQDLNPYSLIVITIELKKKKKKKLINCLDAKDYMKFVTINFKICHVARLAYAWKYIFSQDK